MNAPSGENPETGLRLALDFAKLDSVRGVVPVVVQRADTREVVLLAYVNQEAFSLSMRTRRLFLWSTSRGKLWEKGAESGHRFEIESAYVNCEQNSLLFKVLPYPRGASHGICHTNNAAGAARNCFYRRILPDGATLRNEDP